MPRVATRPEVYLALSPAATATALGISYSHVRDAINEGVLPVYVVGVKHRIHVSDIERFLRSFPSPAKRKYTKRRSVPHE
ncbi:MULTISPECIES: helix-turn-helix domain-containing protein [Bradyrhizobium]|jgi:excisionase family DNA binding protein|uniref:DNA binding domain-containing protein, excisionase family n=2 Tax=Bradyrhizobium TaxID=374 RepID=A0ABY0PJR5_9BRAD|nr:MULTISPECIES: helix-turn-helix domain-containing protein [Bradyrhizobium]SDI54226.1 DNA binding domain-containing protein, excisionase family [Bradyrhizobium ottawaense]SED43230.1 DNA binding domain-containing protein, excisionase family [Bradyrhizobium lablabi]